MVIMDAALTDSAPAAAVLTIELPSMVAGRAMADVLVDRLEGDLAGARVLLDCRHLVSGSPSFAARLVARLLVTGDAAALQVTAPTAAFAHAMSDAAARQGVADRLVVRGTAVAA